jgi:hypothetical protein
MRGESYFSFSNLVKVSQVLGIMLSQLLLGFEKRAGLSGPTEQ